METHSPIKVKPLPNYKLWLKFDNGEIKIFNAKPYLEDEYFSALRDVATFNSVKINPITVEWNNCIDICPDELYYNSESITKK